MRRFAWAAVVLSLFGAAPAGAEEREVDLELVLAVDVSGSIDLEEATLQRQGLIGAIRHPRVVSAIRRGALGRIAVSYVEWAGAHYQSALIDWREVSDRASAEAFAEALERLPIRTQLWTSISMAMLHGAQSFERNGFRAPRRIIDISGDGPNNKGPYVVDARDQAVAQGAVINGLAIVNGRPGPYGFPQLANLDLYYEDCVIGGIGAFVIVAQGFEDFARAILRKMVLEIAGLRPPSTLLRRADGRPRPPCTAGELQLERWSAGRSDF